MAEAANGSPNRSAQLIRGAAESDVQTWPVPATSATWSSWIRVRCQTSQAIELDAAVRPERQLPGRQPVDGVVHDFPDPAERVG